MLRAASYRLALAVLAVAACHTVPPPAPPTPPKPAPVEAEPGRQPVVPPPEVPAPLVVPDGVRLPRAFAIERAELEQQLDPAKETLAGRVRYEGTLREATAVIWLHAEDVTITRAVATPLVTPEPPAGAKPAPPPVPLEVVSGLARGKVALRASAPLGAGLRYALELEYTAPIDSVQTAGTFRQQLDGRWYAYTQHESIFARRSFPCLDEPDLKIPWTIALTVPAGLVAVSNAPETSRSTLADGRVRVQFAPTEPLPSYLIAYAVGPFELVPAGTTSGGAPIRIITPAGKAAEAAFAAEATPKLVRALEAWFGTPYPFAKLDSIAIPTTVGFSAMENAGLITYTERRLLMAPDADDSRRRGYVGIAAHELAHQWFGDLVTPVWWDDIWLNESFASWVPAKAIAVAYPAYRRAEDDTLARSATLVGDSLSSARRIRQPIASEDDIVTAFDGITYGKGAAVLRMMEAWVGADRFQAGVRAYLAEHARGNATATDFVRAIAAHGDAPEVERAFASFLDQVGAPRVEATIACTGGAAVRLSQRRYVPLGAAPDAATRWQLPVCVVAGGGAKVERACGVLDGDELQVPLSTCPRWVWPNAEARGYFRSALSAEGWAALRKDGWKRLSTTERIAAVQDLWAAVAAGEVGADRALDWLPALLAEKSPRALQVATDIVGGVRVWLSPSGRTKLAAWAQRHLGKRARALGWLPRKGESADDQDVRERLVPLLAAQGDRELGRAAVKLSGDWRALPEGQRRVILQAAVRADPRVHDRLLADFRVEQEHPRAGDLANALGVVRDPVRLRAALALVIDPAVDVRDSIGVMIAAIGDEDARAVAEPFVAENFAAILARLPDEWGAAQVNMLTASCDPAKVEPMRALAEEKLAGRRGARRRIDQAFERLGQCVAQRNAQAAAVEAWVAKAR